MSRDGLASHGIDVEDIDRYLSVIEQRVSRGRTGSQWMVQSLTGMQGRGNLSERLSALTAALVARQKDGQPVGEWEPARLEEAGVWRDNFLTVEQFMTTDLFTVSEDESLDLVANLMEWNQVRHIPVEDHVHRLIGLVSYRCLIKLMAKGMLTNGERPIAVSDIMKRDLVTVAPDLATLEAIELMRKHRISCLPVVQGDRLVGILTERDLMDLAAELIRKQLSQR
jgi:CBS domain-containing protein